MVLWKTHLLVVILQPDSVKPAPATIIQKKKKKQEMHNLSSSALCRNMRAQKKVFGPH